jgi:hypothetical protein
MTDPAARDRITEIMIYNNVSEGIFRCSFPTGALQDGHLVRKVQKRTPIMTAYSLKT